MGMSVGGSSGGVKSEINVTPLVDVVLVLLIIFLVTMPVVMRTVTLEVPRKAEANEDTSTASKSIIIKQKADGTIDLEDGESAEPRSISSLDLAPELRKVLERKQGEKVVFVDFEDEVNWGDVVTTMDRVRSLAEDTDHNAIKVALKKREEAAAGAPPAP